MLVIHDDHIARQLQQIAEKEHRPVEDVLKSMIAWIAVFLLRCTI
jgi:predicted transcriptional regulator